ncbi:hypothetical protein BDY19DRAFT_989714 [Irpex rosettiformis]|uniref:Uncharacterized protein n=1 Tax=Irpex rosettiformis TaxID=378272 RepID=A0ACB8UFF8_9APHY|nr:hypothetical protein BDY19DRAFT_989714 [Irpex rosettiformis]
MSSSTRTDIQVYTKYVPPSERTLPALALQITQLVGSYMVWVGITDEPAEKVDIAPSQGFLLKDWACAMPPTSVGIPPAATNLYRSSSSDVSLSMAQRLARRFKRQIFLAVDVPPAFTTLGDGPKVVLAAEQAVVQALQELEARGSI